MADNALSFFEEDKMVGEAVEEFVNDALNAFEQRVDEIFISTLDVPYATEMSMMKLQKLIELAMLEHDGKQLRDDEQLEVFMPDGEPMPSTIDSWARGTVPVKKLTAEEHYGIPHAFSNDAPSVSSAYTKSSFGRSSRASSRKTSRTAGTSGTTHTGPMDNTGKIIELDEDGDDFGSFSATGYMFDMLQKSKRKKENGFIEKDTEKGEFTVIEEQMEQAKKELRGKKFVLDRYGKPVVVGSVAADKLPPFTMPLGMNIKSAGGEVDLDNMSTGSGGSMGAGGGGLARKGSQQSQSSATGAGAGVAKGKKKNFIRVAGSRGVERGDAFKPTLSLAVTLAGVEVIPKLNAGVTVRSSTSVRTGERLPEDPKRISRKQYETQSLYRRSVTGDNSTLDTMTMMSRTLEGGNSSVYSPDRRGEKSVFSSTSGGRSLGGQSRAGGSVTTMKSLDGLPDLDRMEGSRPVHRPVPAVRDATDEELGLGPALTKGAPAATQLPVKPSLKQQANISLLAGSPDNGKPKDRDLPKNMRPVAERKHLAAPPLGHIAGHGLTFEKTRDKSEFSMTEEENW